MSLRRDVLANYAGTLIQVLAPVLALPWYLESLGPKVYGLLSFVMLLQTVLALIDAGLSQSLMREFAVRADGTPLGLKRVAHLLSGMQFVYWGGAVLLGVLTVIAAPMVSSHWISLDGLGPEDGTRAVMGGALIFVAQIPGSLYRSVLIGLHCQATLQYSMMAWTLLRHGFGVVLMSVWPDLLVYLAWQTFVGAAETGSRFLLVRVVAHVHPGMRADLAEVRSVLIPALKMSGAICLGALAVQIDRVLLSGNVGVEQFGYYSIAASVAVGAMQAVNPLTMATLPRAISARNDPAVLFRLSLRLFAMNACVVCVGGVAFMLFGQRLLAWWLRDAIAVAAILPILSIALWGTALNALYNVGYVNWLARGRTDRILTVNLLSLSVSLVSIPPLVARFGLVGAAFGWVAMNAIGFVLGLEWLAKTKVKRVDDAGS